MRKKILSALLLGLFTVASTSTFVSCKDYDDDISDLQGQVTDQNTLINGLKEKLSAAESAVTSLQAADVKINEEIGKLQTADKDFLKKTDAAETYATKQLVNDTKTKLEQAIDDAKKAAETGDANTLIAAEAKISSAIEVAKAELNAAINLKANQSDLEAAQNKLTEVSNKLNTLSDNYTKFIGEYTSLKAALDAQKKVLESDYAKKIAEGDVATLASAKEEVAKVQTQLNTAKQELEKKLDDEIEAVQKKVAEDLTGINTTIGQLKAAHDGFATKDQFTQLNNQLTTLVEEKIPAVEKSVTTLETKLGANINVVSAALAKALRSLVFQPDLYVDGIEAFQYPFRVDTTLVKVDVATYTRTQRKGETTSHLISKVTDYKHGTGSVTLVTPLAWPVEYHANPSTTDTKFANIKGFAVREATVISRGASSVKFNAVEKYLDDTQLFSNKNGIITVGLQVADADKAKFVDAQGNIIKGAVATGTDYIAALQSYSSLDGTQGKDTVITSDYAMLYPEKMWVEGLVWTDMKLKAGEFDEIGAAQKKVGDADKDHDGRPGKFSGCAKKCHVWDTPEEALAELSKDAVQLYYNDEKGIQLDQFLGVHMVRETKAKGATTFSKPETVNLTDAKFGQYGLKYEFELVNYIIDSNKTSDSKFCNLDAKTGKIIAQNVLAGEKPGDQSASSVNREPLVRVLVKDIKTGAVIKDGYILVHITKEAPGTDPENAKTVDLHTYTHMFDLCKGKIFDATSYAEFNQYVLTDGLDNLEKVNFDAQYTIDAKSTTGEISVVNHYTEPLAKKDNSAKLNKVGTVKHRKNVDGTTNDAFWVEFTAAELENLTHDAQLKDGKYTYVTYARYEGNKGAGAKYDYLYIKLTVELTRVAVGKFGIKTKNIDYWFGKDGSDAGLEAVVFNCNSPVNGGDIKIWKRAIQSQFEGNAVVLTGAGATGTVEKKFYFTPEQQVVVETDAVTGEKTTWIITPQPNAADALYKSLVPEYAGDVANHEWKSEAEANEWINKCAIAYDKGVYNNATLYAYKGTVAGNGTKIATINQVSGEVTLDHNATTERIINAIAYAGHLNINTEFRAQIGVIASKGCTVLQSEDATFLASWQRPINPADAYAKVKVDAKTNADTIFVADILKFYDFRGPVEGQMETAATKWLWAYYNIKSIEVDCTPSNVYTNMGLLDDQDDDFQKLDKKLSVVAPNARLYAYDNATQSEKQVGTATFNLRYLNGVNYNDAGKSEDLYKIFNGTNKDKEQFGYIIYYNSGANVTRFSVRIPIKVTYEWGTFKTYVTVAIHRTLGN